MKIEHDSRVPLWILSIAVLATFSPGQYSTDFESVSASPAGTPLAGQGASAQTGPQGYYVPSTIGSASLDFNAHSYANNSLGVAQNPTGGCNFIGVTGPGNGIFGRTEVDITYPTPVVTVAFDICVRFTGALPANNNIGSVALQPSPGSRRFIAIAVWSDPATATNWDAYYRRFDYNGQTLGGATPVPSPGFAGLLTNHWYRWETDCNISTGEITQLRITDLTSGTTATDNPVGWYLEGGGITELADPTGIRFFSGGGVPGNLACFDNICIAAQNACGLPVLTAPEYQINQAAANIDVNGTTLGAFCAPGTITIAPGISATASFGSTVAGGAWELAASVMPLVAVSSGAPVLSDGQIINVDLSDPGIILLWNGFLSPPFSPFNASLTLPVGTINAQMAIVNPASPSGLSLSQALRITAQ